MGTVSFPGIKCGRGVLLTTHPLQGRGHGRVELYLYPPSGPHRACNGITLPFSFFLLQLYSSCKMTMPFNNRYFIWTKFQMCCDNNVINSDYFFCPRKDAHERGESQINLLKTKRRMLYLKTQFAPRSKHF